MNVSVEGTLAELLRVGSAASDAELAGKLGQDKSTVSVWRARGQVPTRFVKMVEEPCSGVELGALSGELQESAYPIAFARFILIRHAVVRSASADRAIPVLRDKTPFWLVRHRAVDDLLSKVEASQEIWKPLRPSFCRTTFETQPDRETGGGQRAGNHADTAWIKVRK